MSVLSVDTPTRQRNGALHGGLVLAAVLAALDVITGILSFAGSFFAPPEIGAAMIVVGVATLVLVPYAWNGRRTPALVAVALRLLSSAAGLPAFFVPDVPTGGIVAAAVGILAAVLCAWLVALGLRKSRK